MYDASNQKLQTLILASTVMFVSTSTVMIQGNLGAEPNPEDPNLSTVRAMAVFGSLSFFFLFVSIVLCVELLNRSASFMMNMSDYQQMKIELYHGIDDDDDEDEDGEKAKKYLKEVVAVKNSTDVKKRWLNHEARMADTMRLVRADREDVFEYPEKRNFFQKSFSQFWTSIETELHCADISFYAGTWFMLLATGI
jgi:hypothetical protein